MSSDQTGMGAQGGHIRGKDPCPRQEMLESQEVLGNCLGKMRPQCLPGPPCPLSRDGKAVYLPSFGQERAE